MKLKYSILWFDDSKEFLDSFPFERLDEAISSWGFEPNIVTSRTAAEFEKYSPFKEFDLIVIDQNLGDHVEGENFIEALRSHGIYTEVVFYSVGGVSQLWKAITENRLEGVFVAGRTDVLEKIVRVGQQAIRKVLDLENTRGIVMAEVGELDLLLDDIVTLGINKASEEQRKKLYDGFHENLTEQIEKYSEELKEFIQSPDVQKMIIMCDSYKRWSNFNRLKKIFPKELKNRSIRNYPTEIIGPRNFLAHGRPTADGKGGYTFAYKGKNYDFNDTVSLDLRKTIMRYKGAFGEIIKIMSV